MSAYSNLSADAGIVVKAFVYAFQSAPTADLIAEGERFLEDGGTPKQLLNFLFNYNAPNSPYPGFNGSSDSLFISQLIDSLAAGTTVSQAKRGEWADALLTMKAGYADRVDFAIAVGVLVETAVTTDPDLLAVRESLKDRLETAATFAGTSAGAHYDGLGFGQLQGPLEPPAPTYQLTANVSSANEGTTIVYQLQTSHVLAGTQVAYSLTGQGITAADLSSGSLTGFLTVGADGRATLSITLASDALTEGAETLLLSLPGHDASVPVTINDTSLNPPPTYQLATSATMANEGSEVVVTLNTTGVAAGTALAYTLSGSNITADDVVGGALAGNFVVDASGVTTLRLTLRADALTEGLETLRLSLVASPNSHVDITINDTSRTPEGGAGTDTFEVSDQMQLAGAGVPATPLEGEIKFNSYLTYDLLNQSGRNAVRMSVADLVASGSVAGAALVTTNQSADRGNLPQVSNAQLLKLDLGEGIDRVDYSAETGRVVAVVPAASQTGAQLVLVNDDGTDNNFSGAADRVDALTGVEEIVASAGGGVIDLTASAGDWTLTFSDGFSSSDIDAARDREVHRIVLRDSLSNVATTTQYLEARDAGSRSDVNVATAAWTVIEGSDHAETLLYTQYEAMAERTANLRGGDNAVSFAGLASSIDVQVAIKPFVASTSLADDSNSTGVLTATTHFTDGNGNALAGAQTNTTSSYTPDNAVAAGSLRLTGSQDAEDAIGFEGTSAALRFTLGRADGSSSARLLSQAAGEALYFSGFETLHDNGSTDDVYSVQNLALALQGPRLVDGSGNDRDTIQLATEALGNAAVGGAGVIDLGVLSGPSGFNYHFATLDIAGVAGSALQVKGTSAVNEMVVVGPLSQLASVTGFESLRLSDSSIDSAAPLVLNLDAGSVWRDGAKLFDYSGSTLSAEGATKDLVLTVIDTTPGTGATLIGGNGADRLTGAAGNDVFRGGRGKDVLDGGSTDGSVSFTLSGAPDGTTSSANRVVLTLNIGGTILTLGEEAVADTQYGDGHGAVLDGASRADIGHALVALVQAHVAASATPLANGLKGASYDDATGVIKLNFVEGSAGSAQVTLQLNNGSDTGSLAVSTGTVVSGAGGSDRFVFEASGSANGTDTILNFGSNDKLDVTAFTGTAITAAATALDATQGGSLSGGAGTAQFIFGRTTMLTAADFAETAQAGKLVLADGAKTVIAVTADPTGAHGDAANTAISLYFVENGSAAGLGDLSVSLVGTISGPNELSFADIFGSLS